MADKNMAYSLIFKVIDGASATIKSIANVMGEPADAAGKWADAVDKSGDRQVSAFRKVKDALGEVAQAVTAPVRAMAELGKAAAEASERFSRSFAGIGAIAAEGFSIKNVAQQEEFFRRLQINTGMSVDAIKELREQINMAADAYGVSHDKLMQAFGAFRANGGDIKTFGENVKAVSATIQLTGMDAENAGQMFAFLSTKMQIKSPDQFISTLATMRQQLKGIPDGMDAFAEATMRLSAPMQALHMSGQQAALGIAAVYAVAARSTGGGRRAISATEMWLNQLSDRGYQNQLSQGLGQRITDQNGYVMDPRILMQKMAQAYANVSKLPANQQVVAEQRLDALFGEAASRMFKSVGGEIKATGHSTTIDKVLGAQGNGSEFMDKAQQASEGLSGSMNRLRTAMDKASESLFADPINLFAKALSHCTGVVADLVLTFASFVAIGQGIKWIGGAISGFQMLAGVVPVVIDVIGALAVGFVQLTLAMLASPITWIVAAIALVGVAAYELYQHWDSVWKAMGLAVKWLGDLIGPVFKSPFVSAILSVMSPALSLLAMPKMLGAAWTAAGQTIASIWQSIRKVAEPVLDYIAKRWDETWGRISQAGHWFSRLTGIGGGGSSGSAPQAAPTDPAGAAAGSVGGVTGGAVSNFMAHVRAGESGGNDHARAGTSSATGRYQFTDATWLNYYAQTFGNQGLSRSAILARRHDGATQDAVMKTAVADYSNMLTRMGAEVNDANLYLVHFAGEAGARRLLSANPGANAAAVMGPKAAAANPWLAGKSVADVRNMLARRVNGAAVGGASTPQLAMRGGGLLPPSASSGVAIPTNIYGPSGGAGAVGGGAGGGFADASPFGGSDGGMPRQARAHLTVSFDEKTGRHRARVDHSEGMDVTLDRGRSMTASWG